MVRNSLWVLLALTPVLAQAQASRIDQVLVYPGGAQVERVVVVKAGARELRLPCLPASFDANSLRLSGAGVSIGEINVQTVKAEAAPECNDTPMDARIRELEDQRAAVTAELAAQGVTVEYLKHVGQSIAATQIAAAADSVRTQATAALQREQPLKRRQEELTRQLAPLVAERDRLRKANPQRQSLTAQISAQRDTELRLLYQVPVAGWQPVYRAYLDSSSGKVRLERRAEVGQSSGEDWSGVSLRLSTVQPRQAVGSSPPWPWTLEIEPPMQKAKAVGGLMRIAGLAAPAPMAADVARPGAPSFDVSVFEGEFATEFQVPNRVNVSASGERVTFDLGGAALESRVLARTTPQQEATAYLVAESTRPTGVWPAGRMQLFRDGSFIGESQLAMPADGKLDLPFGRDEQIRVVVEPQARNAGDRGFISSRIEQKITHSYRIESQHSKPFIVQVLEASPVSRHEDIKVEAKFDPQPQAKDWRDQPGVKAWEFTLAPNASQTLKADYTISYPKDANVSGMR
ncbi:MAG TPA: DUF4139 domain-containing protein [Burkholderiaceae bacterium]|jgi:uncharacterized protein (TIGR02231 family)